MMDTQQKLGFDKVREMIAAKCSTHYAERRVADESFCTEEEIIMQRLCITDEMRLVCMFEDAFPSSGYIDARPFLMPLQAEESCISLESLVSLRTSQDTLRRIMAFFRSCDESLYPRLRAMADSVSYFPEVSRRIDLIIDKFGQVRDSASPELQAIRRSLREKEGTISKRINSILKKAQGDGIVDEGADVSVREGRILIPVAAANKRKLPGLVYDESASGKTAFVEPMEVVELNNQVRELRFEEQREILHILSEFTGFLRPYLPDIIAGAEYMGELDFIRAKALVAIDMKAGLPLLSRERTMILRKARHPLLERALSHEGKAIVPLTMELSPSRHILLISGPNAGGKSVCLKTVGLLQYMFQWGMLIPTSEISEMVVFDDIFIDIGDDQSIENDLSTYSSHLYNMKRLLEEAGKGSLVLIDEFGSGTEPAAGGAIAEAILRELDQRGVFGVITTHYTNLKLYADSSRGVINGAMQFDVQNIRPLFNLEVGLPGNSFAFEIARKIGLPETVLHKAEELAGSDYVDIERNLRKIARNKRQIDEKLARIRTTDKTLETITDKYQKELSEVKELRRKVLEEARAEAKEIVAEANRQVEATIRTIRETQADRERTREVRKSLDEFKQKIERKNVVDDSIIDRKMQQIVERRQRESERKAKRAGKALQAAGAAKKAGKVESPEGPVVPGDKVVIKDNGMVGEVTRVSAKMVWIAVGSITSRMKTDSVEKISAQKYKELQKPPKAVSSIDAYAISESRLNFKPQIDVRGARLNEALDIVTKFIDDAIMLGMGQVRILHGKGNGILREEIQKYLRTIPGVGQVRDEHIEAGGTGITVVTLDI